jgi:hypothetical protein
MPAPAPAPAPNPHRANTPLPPAVEDHSEWLRANCDTQRSYYEEYLNTCRAAAPARLGLAPSGSLGSSSGAAGEPTAQQLVAAGSSAAKPGQTSSAAVEAVKSFSPGAAALLLEEEIREAFLGTAGTAAGAQGVGLLAASWLGTTLEDLLAVALAGAASYVAVLNLPLRRADIKAKVASTAGKFVADVEGEMLREVKSSVAAVLAEVDAALGPIEEAYKKEARRVAEAEARSARLEAALAELSQKVANV